MLALLTGSPVAALDPARLLTQYRARSWAGQLPDPTVTSLLQTGDGCL
jgi:ligand-binding sensor domain-containing protein